MTAGAWRRLRAHWQLPLTGRLLWQSYVAGSLFSALGSAQSALTAEQTRQASLAGSIFVLGYWRSGTTLLHDYLCQDQRFGYASTYACMQPHHFVLTQAAALARYQSAVRRPMDDVEITAASPQEDEFALLSLGARSPYEALLAPQHLAEALSLADPRDLGAEERERWRQTFATFARGVSIVAGRRPLILKSPTHGYRVPTLRELVPDARFVLIVRSPEIVYESVIRMWHSLFPLYALTEIPPEEQTRRIVLADRLRFEAKLSAGLAGLPAHRLALVRYEDLIASPVAVIGQVYEQLELPGFAAIEPAIRDEHARRRKYAARNALPPERWLRELLTAWQPVFEGYGYDLPRL